jgi:hypothetical protein
MTAGHIESTTRTSDQIDLRERFEQSFRRSSKVLVPYKYEKLQSTFVIAAFRHS